MKKRKNTVAKSLRLASNRQRIVPSKREAKLEKERLKDEQGSEGEG